YELKAAGAFRTTAPPNKRLAKFKISNDIPKELLPPQLPKPTYYELKAAGAFRNSGGPGGRLTQKQLIRLNQQARGSVEDVVPTSAGATPSYVALRRWREQFGVLK